MDEDKIDNKKQDIKKEITDSIDSSGQCETSAKSTNEPFKKPLLIIGPQRGKSNQNKSCRTIKETEKNHDISINLSSVKSDCTPGFQKETHMINNSSLQPITPKSSPVLPYEEPDWGGCPLHEYKLEELKSGTIVKTIDISNRSYSVFGRLESCDIPMLHPTVSRYHAVLQYRVNGDENNEPGFYIYDLDSSLGTFLNKKKVKSRTFVRMKVGHMVKVGCSTRMFILQGPEDDVEPESELSVTELKQQHQARLAEMEAEKTRQELEREERMKMEEERGIDWGMGEDADEETDLTENPFASTQNEELFLDDPKKTLRGWFEREGEELVYDVEEKGFGHFVCRIELPIDSETGSNVVAEASVKGKKKEAVVQAALEACRMLDRQGLLRQATHESKKRAAKDWEANDFYDSDEDNFLDRTGQIERKRQQRMAQSGKLEAEVETYDTLMKKYEVIVKELEQTERRLNDMLSLALNTGALQEGDWEDELEAYMSSLKGVTADKIEIKKTKAEVTRLKMEESRLRKLVNIARPAELPKLLEPILKPNKERKELPPVMIGKKCIKKRTHQETILPMETTQQKTDGDSPEEEDEEEEDEDPKLQKDKQEPTEDQKVSEVKKKRRRPDTRVRTGKQKHLQTQQMDGEEFSSCTWTPPVGQTGDGRTSLNDKLGY